MANHPSHLRVLALSLCLSVAGVAGELTAGELPRSHTRHGHLSSQSYRMHAVRFEGGTPSTVTLISRMTNREIRTPLDIPAPLELRILDRHGRLIAHQYEDMQGDGVDWMPPQTDSYWIVVINPGLAPVGYALFTD